MKRRTLLGCSVALLALGAGVQAAAQGVPRTKSPEGVQVYFITPRNGETVASPFVVRFGLKGMGIAPVGTDTANTGHHHLLIDVDKLPPEDMPLPTTDNVRHFGGGQTETELKLPPGQHTLQLLLGDKNHIPHDKPVMSEKITITVK